MLRAMNAGDGDGDGKGVGGFLRGGVKEGEGVGLDPGIGGNFGVVVGCCIGDDR